MVNNSNSVILISKDVLGKFYLPIYGNEYWKGKTPNIDELAAKGTVFYRHYTAAPSSAMSYFSMWTELYAHQTKRKDYLPIKEKEGFVSVFDKTYELGFDNHIIWDANWMSTAKLYSECYGNHVTYNSINGIRQPVGSHQNHDHVLACDEHLVDETIMKIKYEIESICSENRKVFIWMHLPHVMHGRNSYGSDIDVFDRIVGVAREFFNDDNIFITADHGNMNGSHGKIGYGFDVYEAASCIPFISPRINNIAAVNYPTTSCDLFKIIFERVIPYREVIYSDSAYYCQLHRKLAIIKGNYKYIFNRKDHTEELYDVVYDPSENVNLISDRIYDVDRHMSCPLQEMYFYPHWKDLSAIRQKMRAYKNEVWREGTYAEKIYTYYLHIGKIIWRVVSTHFRAYGIHITIHSNKKK